MSLKDFRNANLVFFYQMGAADTRRKRIVEVVTSKGFMTVVDLAEKFNVTSATIRTDLNALEESNMLIRSHGGAIPGVAKVVNLKDDDKARNNRDLKMRIAAAAAKLVKPGDSITIASGSTMNFFAEQIATNGRINILTPSLRIASRLVDNPMVSLFFLGGYINDFTYSAYGTYATAGLDIFHSDKLFFGVEGFSVDGGLSCGFLEEADLTKKMMKSATQMIVLADSTKFRRRGFCSICALKDIDILITDDGLNDASRREITELGVELIIV